MANVAATLRQAAYTGLGQEPPEEWIDQWIRINNPRLYTVMPDIGKIARMIDEMHERFVDINKDVKEYEDILLHKHRMLVRIAYNAVSIDKATSFSLFWRVCRNDIKVAAAIIPKYILAFIFGKQVARLYRSVKNHFEMIII
jgi:hypothetical protein